MWKTIFIVAFASVSAAAAGATADVAFERGRLEAEIERLGGAFAAEEAACQKRFAVTACVEDVRLRRRDVLGSLRLRLLALDGADRRRRAESRLAAIRAKRQARRESAAEAAPSTPLPAVERPPLPDLDPLLVLRRVDAAAKRQHAASAAAAQRATAAQRRRQQAEDDTAQMGEKVLERERSGKLAAPVPVPAAMR